MKYAVVSLVTAVVVALAVYAKCYIDNVRLYLPEYDENGERCEGDCDEDIPCQYCHPNR